MEIDKINSLVELYFKKCEAVDPNKPFLKWLKPGKPTYSWGYIKERIFKLSSKTFDVNEKKVYQYIIGSEACRYIFIRFSHHKKIEINKMMTLYRTVL